MKGVPSISFVPGVSEKKPAGRITLARLTSAERRTNFGKNVYQYGETILGRGFGVPGVSLRGPG